MSIEFALLLLPIILFPILAFMKFRSTITVGETACTMAVMFLIIGGVYTAGKYADTIDTQVLNGKVVSKSRDRVSCSHSYSCNCTTSTYTCGKSTCTRTSCQTCYEHSHDYDWNVSSTVGSFTIDRVDRQGVDIPPRWQSVLIGEPAAVTETYTNYVKGAKDSLFHTLIDDDKWAAHIPNYPRPFDYYRINHYIASQKPSDLEKQHAPLYDKYLDDMLSTLGPSKEVNVLVVMSNHKSAMHGEALKNAWLGGKKNDVIVVIGAPSYPTIEWVRVFSWSKTEMVNVVLRNNLLALKEAEPKKVVDIIKQDVTQYFQRKSMQEFEYLKDNLQPPMWVMVLAWILSLFGTIGLTWWFHKNETF